MPREKILYKYKCLEIGCHQYIRGDKWKAHITTKHKYKYINNMEITRQLFQTKEKQGPWKNVTNNNSLPGEISNTIITSLSDDNICAADSQQVGDLTIISPSIDSSVTGIFPIVDAKTISPSIDSSATGTFPIVDANTISPSIDSSATGTFPIVDSNTISPSIDSSATGTFPTIDLNIIPLSADQNDKDAGKFDNDPAFYSKIRMTSQTINQILAIKNMLPDIFPKDLRNRCCQHEWFENKPSTPYSSKTTRRWLVYSESKNSLFCQDCIIFGGPTASAVWTKDGYVDWNHALRDIEVHENSSQHKKSEIGRLTWVGQKGRIDYLFSVQQNALVEQNRRVLAVAIDCIKYLSREMMALRGHNVSEGKFVGLFTLLSKYDTSANAYLKKLAETKAKHQKPELNLLSPLNQRRLLLTMKKMVVNIIATRVKGEGVCSLILDSTQDSSRLEATSVIIRYLENGEHQSRPRERLIEVFCTGETNGGIMLEKVENIFDACGLDLNMLVGTSLDGAGNMRGKYKGLQALVNQKNPKSLYVWCYAHRLNLVFEACLNCCVDMRNTLGILGEIHNFFTGHKRHAALMEEQKGEKCPQTTKRVSDATRTWRSVEDAVNMLLSKWESVIRTLVRLCSDKDPSTVSGANGLLKSLNDVNVIFCFHLVKNVTTYTGPVSRLLQSTSLDLGMACSLIKSLKGNINKLRCSDSAFSELYEKCTAFCQLQHVEKEPKRVRKRRRLFDEVCDDEVVSDMERRLKCETFIPVLDILYTQLEDRFSEGAVAILQDLNHFTAGELSREARPDITAHDIAALCQYYGFDNGTVANELNAFHHVFCAVKEHVSIADLLSTSVLPDHSKASDSDSEEEETIDNDKLWKRNNFIHPYRVLLEMSGFSNLRSVYKVLLTLPITNTSAERSMSRVRLIKNRLRTTMSDDWFSGLMILSSEKDIVECLTAEDITKEFANLSIPLKNCFYFS
jgi:hypothetical protein